MLKAIDPLLGPRLLYLLAAMGHGDEIALVDRNYPACFAGPEVTLLSGVDTTEASRAIFTLLPLDTFIEHPVAAMEPGTGNGGVPASHHDVIESAKLAEGRELQIKYLARHDFYNRAKNVRTIIQTSDARPFSCFLFTKGVIF